MNCKNCGAVLTGAETFCRACGNPVEQGQAPTMVNPEINNEQPVMMTQVPNQPVVDSQPMMPEAAPTVDPMMAQPTMPGAAPATTQNMVQPNSMGVATPTPVQANVQPSQQPANQPANKNKTLILIITLVVVVIIAIVLFAVVLNKEKPTEPDNGGSGTETVEGVSVNPSNIQSYAGYDFTVPEGYNAEIDAQLGLLIYNDSIAYSVDIDYTNSYAAYRAEFEKRYPDQMSKAEVTIGGRKYLALSIYDVQTYQFKYIQYITDVNGTTFTGLCFKRDKTVPAQAEFMTLTTFLNSASKGSSNFSAGDDQDAGKDGVKVFDVTPDIFNN